MKQIIKIILHGFLTGALCAYVLFYVFFILPVVVLDILESYWKILFPVFIATGIGYFYLMTLKKRYLKDRKNAPLWLKIVLIPQVIVFLLLDWFLNVLLTIPMLDFPSKPVELTTGRMKRYKLEVYRPDGSYNYWQLNPLQRYRYHFALWLCDQLNRGEKDHC